ncbi:PIN domain-containing protein [Terracidiphilus sp.]|uniref:PIN domain-containing protein n=1 Tax=Terracidiphilus sp. TaxID=1964191 RepID=UPI003C21A748
MSVVLDSDIVIEILRERNPPVLAAWTDLIISSRPILCTPIVVAEVWAGARPKEHRQIDSFLGQIICLESDEETGKIAGDLLSQYARSHNMEVPDAMIAAAAIQHRAALWTRNRKHYPMPQITFYS